MEMVVIHHDILKPPCKSLVSYYGNILSAQLFWALSKGYTVRRQKDSGRRRLFVADSSSLDMLQDLALYAELLVFLVGTFVYGFLARELLQQKAILPGNRPIRVLALSLTLWYAGSLVDELASILIPGSGFWSAVGPAVDVARAFGLLRF